MIKYGWFKCGVCGKRCRVWVESDSYKRKLCHVHLKEELNLPI